MALSNGHTAEVAWRKSLSAKFVAVVVAISLLIGGVSAQSLSIAFAEGASTNASASLASATTKAVNIGTGNLAVPEGGWTTDAGSYLYLGSNSGTPIKWRVVKNAGDTVLLDANEILWKGAFLNLDNVGDEDPINYDVSDIRSYLKDGNDVNGSALFAAAELNALQSTSLAAKSSYTPSRYTEEYTYSDVASTGNKAFILSTDEIDTLYASNYDAIKSGSDPDHPCYWTRSNLNVADLDLEIGAVLCSDGSFNSHGVDCDAEYGGVAPATNLVSNNVAFVTSNSFDKTKAISAVSAESGKEWKATLKDTSLKVTLEKGTKVGNELTVPYTVQGNASQVSIVITSGSVFNSSSDVLYYGKLADVASTSANLNASQTATVTLPDGLPSGSQIYVMAEDVNGANLTDYASEPVEVTYTDMCTVTFNANGGSPAPAQQTVEKGKTATEPAAMTKSGYTFKGWYATSTFEGSAFDFSTAITANTTLHAKWESDGSSDGGDGDNTDGDGDSDNNNNNGDGSDSGDGSGDDSSTYVTDASGSGTSNGSGDGSGTSSNGSLAQTGDTLSTVVLAVLIAALVASCIVVSSRKLFATSRGAHAKSRLPFKK